MNMKIRRIGSITCGGLLVLFGILFLLHIFLPMLSYRLIFQLWPLILVSLGVEMLLSNRKSKEQQCQYDGGAIALTLILAFFAMAMGMAEFCMEYEGVYLNW